MIESDPARGERSRGVSSGRSHQDHLVAFDLETTGLSPRSDRLLEIGAVRYDEALRPIDELQVLVDPQIPIPLAIQRLVGLTDDDVSGSPPPSEAAAQLAPGMTSSSAAMDQSRMNGGNRLMGWLALSHG